MAGFVLIHGAFHGGWCFDPVSEILRARGHTVAAPDLPGMGGDEAALRAATLAGWADFTLDVCRAVRSEIGDAPLVLAGHSRGGPVISAAAEADPAAIDALAYISALMVPPDATTEVLKAISPMPTTVMTQLITVENGAGMRVDPEWARGAFAHLSPTALVDAAMPRLVTEPLGPMLTPAKVTHERWGSVARTYIHCRHDRSIGMDRQTKMVELSPGTTTVAIEADHSPFLSAPGPLADALIEVAERAA
jgi:pimeloyl-ACP methyl ester carboxylesterase